MDEFARLLKLDGWFEWGADDVKAEPSGDLGVAAASSPQGATNPELLKQKESATVMYLLSALERFEKLSDAQVQQIGKEIAVRGMEGIDYTAPDRAYTLSAFPDEKFSGLQMLCLMYVAFQKIDATVDVGLDFKDAYARAVKMRQARAN